ncbi:transposase [Streptomyces noursei]|uniref:transposase n=1 Tax=Streptomyces noursei TaxID=1971 RepID=UPI0035716277
MRHGTTNLFAALNVATGEVLGECKPNRNAANSLAFLKKAVKQHAGKEIHVVLDNLPTYTTSEGKAWLAKNVHVHFIHRRLSMAQPDRDLVRDRLPASHPSRYVLQRSCPDQVNPRLHRLVEPGREALHLDCDRRRDPRQGPPHPDPGEETRQ